MHIVIKWFEGKYPAFNVGLCAKEGVDEFLSIKGCKIMSGSKGEFVSWPATKNESSGKYWNHVWANEKFAAAVLEKAKASMPQQTSASRQGASLDSIESDIPF